MFTEIFAPDAARSSSAFSVDVNERRPAAARFGSRRLPLRRDPRCDSAALLGSGGCPRAGFLPVGSRWRMAPVGAGGTSSGTVLLWVLDVCVQLSAGSAARASAVGRASGPARSPDGDALVRVEPEGVGLRDAERIVERVDVADDLVAAELVGRVRVDRQQTDGLGIPPLLLPDLRPAQEQALDAGVAVDLGRLDGLVAVARSGAARRPSARCRGRRGRRCSRRS